MPSCMRAASLALLLVATIAPTITGSAAAADKWPDRPVKVILPYAPGGATDFIGRPWADALSKEFHQQFVVENRGGASGTIGAEAAARSDPDGYTFLLSPNSALTIVTQLREVQYDPHKDFIPVARVGDLVCGFVVRTSVPVTSLKELIEYARKNPGKLAYGSAGLGTSSQMRLEMLKLRTGVDILHVPYRGSADALNDLLAGQVHMMNEINVIPHVRSGKLRLLDVNYPTRHPDFPDVPTLTEAGYPDSDVPIWYAVYAPKGTPEAIVNALNERIVKLADSPEMIKKMREINVVVPKQTPAELKAFMENDFKVNAKLIKEADIKL